MQCVCKQRSKKKLLNDQLSALQMPDYQAEDVFILNKTYKLEDET